MVFGSFGEKEELAACPLCKLEQLRGVLCIIAQDDGVRREFGFDGAEFVGFEFRGMVTVMNEEIDGVIESCDGGDRISIYNPAELVVRRSEQVTRGGIDVEAEELSRFSFFGVLHEGRGDDARAESFVDAGLDDDARFGGADESIPADAAAKARGSVGDVFFASGSVGANDMVFQRLMVFNFAQVLSNF